MCRICQDNLVGSGRPLIKTVLPAVSPTPNTGHSWRRVDSFRLVSDIRDGVFTPNLDELN